MVGGKRLSITTGCLNRVDFLRQSLKTWLAAPEPDEVIVVDWNNSVPLAESLSDFDDPRLVFARVVDQPYWKNAKCHNLELELATGELILRLDSDYLLGSDFIARHPMSRGLFYAGNWKPYAGDVEKCSLAGTLYACRDDVLSVNGYNEWLMYYGSEDDDLFERLTATGLDRFDVDLATIKHIPHPHRMRYENLEVGKNLPSLGSEDDWNDFARTLHLVHNSRNLATLKKWSPKICWTVWRRAICRGIPCCAATTRGPTKDCLIKFCPQASRPSCAT